MMIRTKAKAVEAVNKEMTATPPLKYNDLCNVIESDRLLEFIACFVFAADQFLPIVVIPKRFCFPETLTTFCLAVVSSLIQATDSAAFRDSTSRAGLSTPPTIKFIGKESVDIQFDFYPSFVIKF